jgi:stearoyl-CoA desaturase (delta-9 desaturase)
MHWQVQDDTAVVGAAESKDSAQALVARRATAAIPKEQVDNLLATYHPTSLKAGRIDWVVFGWMLVMHLGCLAAPFYFTWPAFFVAVFFYWLTGSIGICLGYHRFLSHKGFKLAKPARFFVDLCGCLSGEGSPLTWVATHRLHHARSDRPGDPHSPHEGAIWSHLLWLFVKHTPEEQKTLHERFAPDLVHDPMMQFFEKTYIFWSIALGAILYAVGGMPMLLWGMAVRLVAMYHSTWLVNSATHLWGYRNYETKDDSRNNWFVALVSFGEGWHNNHHAHPRIARAGHRWWEIDITYYVIYLMKKTGLATDVIDQVPARR